jgi:endonuclease YncB( thermonuclease family)
VSYGWRRSTPRPFYKSLIDALAFAACLAMVALVLDWRGAFRPATGTYTAVDGDSLRRGEESVRLYGIDAPELHQTCIDGRGADYPCGREARAALSDLVSGQTLNCLARDTDRYGRNVATCSIGVRDIADAMVRRGWAIAYRRHSLDYVTTEAEARKARRGIWQGSFEEPERWRADHRRGPVRGDMAGDDENDARFLKGSP